jgi:hypothetical protein
VAREKVAGSSPVGHPLQNLRICRKNITIREKAGSPARPS